MSEENIKMKEEELDEEFDKMWTETVNELSFAKMKVEDIFTSVSHHLRTNLEQKGSQANGLLSKKPLKEYGLVPFKYTVEGFLNKGADKVKQWFKIPGNAKAVQQTADSIITDCSQMMTDKMKKKSNCHDTYIEEILNMIDERLQNNQEVGTDITFEVSLKQHICADAARRFQKMHEDFLQKKDPYRCLNKNKEKFLTDFKDVFHNVDQCQKKAEEFTDRCLKHAVEDFDNRSLGPDIIGEMRTSEEFSTRMSFQY
ncbi:hypothetical protein KUCAC02_000648 [Chaenocephalus aceratus]|uniref:Uncharacterized protein n=1 Tax=Chaenocephalus aceratus TaxID=36190 RepID=A0ACB9W7E8_CHAAC|nr:hypothetical protein KUCAC02_000648 [Chaenocephalus aceratus]